VRARARAARRRPHAGAGHVRCRCVPPACTSRGAAVRAAAPHGVLSCLSKRTTACLRSCKARHTSGSRAGAAEPGRTAQHIRACWRRPGDPHPTLHLSRRAAPSGAPARRPRTARPSAAAARRPGAARGTAPRTPSGTSSPPSPSPLGTLPARPPARFGRPGHVGALPPVLQARLAWTDAHSFGDAHPLAVVTTLEVFVQCLHAPHRALRMQVALGAAGGALQAGTHDRQRRNPRGRPATLAPQRAARARVRGGARALNATRADSSGGGARRSACAARRRRASSR